MAIVLSLFSESEMTGVAPVPAPSSLSVSAVPADAGACLDASRLNPCPQCSLRGLCDPHECAAHLFPLDSPFPPTRFRNLGEYINCLKHYGWA